MPQQELVVLALSRMQSGVCLAGINQERQAWVRPVLRFGDLSPLHICDRRGVPVDVMDIVALETLEHSPDPPHVEDWVVDLARHRPLILGRVPEEERASLLESLLDLRPEEVLRQEQRSLALIKPSALRWVSFDPSNPQGNYEVRLEFEHPAGPPQPQSRSRGIPVTDLKLRAWGRRWLSNTSTRKELTEGQFQQQLGYQSVYLVIGLSRQYRGQCWPMVVGLHAVPDYRAEIDWANL